MEGFHEAHVVVTVLLHLEQQRELWAALPTERQEQRTIRLGKKLGVKHIAFYATHEDLLSGIS